MDYPAAAPRVTFPKLRDATPDEAKKIISQLIASLPLDDRHNGDQLLKYLEGESPALTRLFVNLQRVANNNPTHPADLNVLDRADTYIRGMMDTDACGVTLAEKFHQAILMGMPADKRLGRTDAERTIGGIF